MPTCPSGHDSASSDFCDVCGMRIDGAAAPAPSAASVPAAASVPSAGAPAAGSQAPPLGPAELCPQCGSGRTGQFCEVCGFDFASGKGRRPAPASAGPAGGAGAGATMAGAATTGAAVPGAAVPGAAGADAAAPGPDAPASGAPDPLASAPAGPAASSPAPSRPAKTADDEAASGPSAGAAAPAGAGPGSGVDAARGGPGPGSGGGAAPGQAGVPGPAAATGAAAGWTAVVTADRGYYDSVIAEGGPDAASIEFPGYCPERRFRLSGREMRIGRRSVSRGLEPEIDLTGPPADPGVSHLHAVLIAEPDGTWAVLDPGSANGTVVNEGEIVAGVRVPLHDGDRVCVGAWTVLTIQAPPAS